MLAPARDVWPPPPCAQPRVWLQPAMSNDANTRLTVQQSVRNSREFMPGLLWLSMVARNHIKP